MRATTSAHGSELRVEILTSVRVLRRRLRRYAHPRATVSTNIVCTSLQQMSSDEKPSIEDQIAMLLAEVVTHRLQIATLREEVEDLRASALLWSALYEALIKAVNERERK